MEESKKPSAAETEQELDQALKATFPASDPVAIGDATGTEADRPVHRRPAVIDKTLVEELARNAAEKQKNRKNS
jgi:hypothetical protein